MTTRSNMRFGVGLLTHKSYYCENRVCNIWWLKVSANVYFHRCTMALLEDSTV